MAIEIKVPPMGESVSEAIIGAIFKPTGSEVVQDEELLELETDKVNQVLYAPSPGRVTLHIKTGDKVVIGQVLGSIDPVSGAQAPKHEEKKKEESKKELPHQETFAIRQSREDFLEKRHSPPMKERAPEVRAETTLSPSAGSEQRKKMSPLRRTIAARLVQVKNETAMLTTFNEVDMTEVMRLRSQEKDAFQKKYSVKLGFMSFFVKAVVQGLKQFPEVNAYLEKDEIITPKHFHIGIAVSTDKGLMVPVLKQAELMSYADIESQIEGFAKKAREGKISLDDLKGGTFTITNGGVFGSLLSTPILNPPQSAILGMHTIQKRAVVINDQIVIRPMMYLALSYDHRVIDGKEAVSFLVAIKQYLEDPTRVLLDL